jgi:hypothetical protein
VATLPGRARHVAPQTSGDGALGVSREGAGAGRK